MNNIYVDELPKSCDNCEFGYFYDCQYCTLRPDLMIKDEWCEKEKHCKLLSLSDRLAEERKKVCDELKRKAEDKYFEIREDCEVPCGWVISEERLQQIERGTYD